MQSGSDGTFLVAHFTTDLIAVQKNVAGTRMAQHIDSGIAGDLFSAIAPENNFVLKIEHAHADLQAVEDIAVGLGISKGWHGGWAQCCCFVHRQKCRALQRRRGRGGIGNSWLNRAKKLELQWLGGMALSG